MDAAELCEKIAISLKDNKATDVCIIDLGGRHSIFSHMIIASSNTARHSMALADYAIEAARHLGVRALHTEGRETKNWISIDFGVIVLHIFLPSVREYYDIG